MQNMGALMRLASLTTAPERNENHRLVKVVFSRGDLVDSQLLGVERSLYFPSGKSPVHAEGHSEEIIYFRQGRGKVLLGEDYVDVGPGSAVAIPGGIAHHVVNSGDDNLEHILISAEIGDCPRQETYLEQPGDCMPQPQTRLLSRLTCRKTVVVEGIRTAEVTRNHHESVYTLSAGFAIAHVKLAGTDYEWQYALDATSCIWIPPSIPHSFRNIGDTPLHLVEFQCRSR
jgi:mannose-6-phosphate isomerase-like protein (cupin superfamily)